MPEVGACKKGSVNKVAGLISPLLKTWGIGESVRLEDIKRSWTEIVGEQISSHTLPVALKDGELTINVDSPLWLQQVSFFKDEIKRKLGPFEITGIRFRHGRAALLRDNAKKQKTTGPAEKKLSKEAMREIEDSVSCIQDPEIRNSIRKLMGKAFLRNTC